MLKKGSEYFLNAQYIIVHTMYYYCLQFFSRPDMAVIVFKTFDVLLKHSYSSG